MEASENLKPEPSAPDTDAPKTNVKKPTPKAFKIFVPIILCPLALANGALFTFSYTLDNQEVGLSAEDQKKYKLAKAHLEAVLEINSLCSQLFTDNYINEDVPDRDFAACYNAATSLGNQNNSLFSNEVLAEAKSYRNYHQEISQMLADFNSANFDTISSFASETEKEISTFSEVYQERLSGPANELSEKVHRVEEAKSLVNNLFDGGNVSENINRNDYNYARGYVDSIERDDVKSELYSRLDTVNNVISERERIAWEKAEAERLAREAAERERQERIANAWHYINVPNYISQNRNNVLNGCEAASLLMALQSKGRLNDVNLHDYAQNMPKSDDPYTGFYLDIFGVEPRNVAHWIDTAPLAEYGRTSSGANVVDLRGSSLDTVANEVANGNPVVIWLTYDYKQPYNWNDGSKMYKNVHVQLVTGYNTETRQFRITDPWTRNNGNYTFYVDWGTVESLYNTIGQRAVVVRDGSAIAKMSATLHAKPLIDALLEGFKKSKLFPENF